MKLDDENWHCLTVSRRDPKTGQFTMEKVPVYHIVDEKEKKKASQHHIPNFFMDLLKKSDEEIYAIARPFWENLVRASNMKDYGGFTRDFSTQMLFGANEVELGKQWANNKIITNLNETYEPFGTLRRGDHITVLIKQTNKEVPGEFLGRLVLGVEDGEVKIFGATIY